MAQGVAVQPILDELAARPDLWDAHTIRKTAPQTPHAGMSDIWVRYHDVAPFEATGDYRTFNDVHVPIWYPAWDALPSLKPVVRTLMACVEGDMIGGVLITRIPSGSGIAAHADTGWHVEYYEKFYLCLQNDPGAVFWCDDGGICEGLTPEPGEIWLFDNRKWHWVTNESGRDRLTVIICIRTALFGRA
jgi:aspartyl/asparaginyl beta-hydroxylase